MRRIVVSTFLSLDGVMQAPGGRGEDPSGGFDQEGWTVNYWDERAGEIMGRFMARPFDLLLGRKTYEIFASYWPNHAEQQEAAPLNAATKYIVSTTLQSADWAPSVLIGKDVVEQLTRLKQGDGPELHVYGSSVLIQTLMAHDLVDEYHLMIFPLLLGRGKRLFGEGVVPAGLRLVDSETSTAGVIIATYERAGDVQLGSFAPDQPRSTEN